MSCRIIFQIHHLYRFFNWKLIKVTQRKQYNNQKAHTNHFNTNQQRMRINGDLSNRILAGICNKPSPRKNFN